MWEEIDGILYLNEDKGILKQFEKTIPFEAKNHSEKVDKNDIIQFNHKIKKMNCKFGMIFSYSGFKQTCYHERNDICLMDKTNLLFFDLSDLEEISKGIRPSKLLAEKYQDLLKKSSS